jgi:hypothetical protein
MANIYRIDPKAPAQHKVLIILLASLLLALWPGSNPARGQTRVDGCQCTDYVYRERADIPLGMGHAKDWLRSARYHRLPYDKIPQVGDVAVILNGEFGFSEEYGHVAIVIQVSQDRQRFGIEGWDGLKDDCHLERHLHLPVTANTFFIHRREPPEPKQPLEVPQLARLERLAGIPVH